MMISFGSDEAIASCSVDVTEEISIAVFTRRLESLLDCASSSTGEWTLKWSETISTYGEPDWVRKVLCDKISSVNSDSGETIGVLKLKRRSVKSGFAKVRLVPAEDSLQIVCRHTSAQGLKSVWKSTLMRLKPQHGSGKESGT